MYIGVDFGGDNLIFPLEFLKKPSSAKYSYSHLLVKLSNWNKEAEENNLDKRIFSLFTYTIKINWMPQI